MTEFIIAYNVHACRNCGIRIPFAWPRRKLAKLTALTHVQKNG